MLCAQPISRRNNLRAGDASKRSCRHPRHERCVLEDDCALMPAPSLENAGWSAFLEDLQQPPRLVQGAWWDWPLLPPAVLSDRSLPASGALTGGSSGRSHQAARTRRGCNTGSSPHTSHSHLLPPACSAQGELYQKVRPVLANFCMSLRKMKS